MRRNCSRRAYAASLTTSGRERYFGAAVERAFGAARDPPRRAPALTAIAIFLVFASVVIILWVGAQDVLPGA